MCIVCRIKIWTEGNKYLRTSVLDISGCQTIQKLEVPEGVTELYCNGCTGLSELKNLSESLRLIECRGCKDLKNLGQLPEGLKGLNCDDCTGLVELKNLPKSLRILYCHGCTGLTDLNNLPKNLQILSCDSCTGLIKIGGSENPLPKYLQELYCRYCTRLAKIGPLPKRLELLSCTGCTNLTEIILSKNLKELFCSYCTKLTQINPQNVIDNLIVYYPSTWSPSENLENNLKKLRIIQRFCRSFRTRKLLRLSRTKEFCEWFYHPENYGGRWDKASLRKIVGRASMTDGGVSEEN